MARFTFPRNIYYMRGSLEVLKSLEEERAFIVVGSGFIKKFGFLDKIL